MTFILCHVHTYFFVSNVYKNLKCIRNSLYLINFYFGVANMNNLQLNLNKPTDYEIITISMILDQFCDTDDSVIKWFISLFSLTKAPNENELNN